MKQLIILLLISFPLYGQVDSIIGYMPTSNGVDSVVYKTYYTPDSIYSIKPPNKLVSTFKLIEGDYWLYCEDSLLYKLVQTLDSTIRYHWENNQWIKGMYSVIYRRDIPTHHLKVLSKIQIQAKYGNVIIDSPIIIDSYKLYDTSGRILLNKKVYSNSIQFKINSSGVYLLELMTPQRREIHKLIIH